MTLAFGGIDACQIGQIVAVTVVLKVDAEGIPNIDHAVRLLPGSIAHGHALLAARARILAKCFQGQGLVRRSERFRVDGKTGSSDCGAFLSLLDAASELHLGCEVDCIKRVLAAQSSLVSASANTMATSPRDALALGSTSLPSSTSPERSSPVSATGLRMA